MKKLLFVAVAFVCATIFASCGNGQTTCNNAQDDTTIVADSTDSTLVVDSLAK